MSRKRISKQHLSADELKSKLYAHFEEIGSLDQIKTQLRSELYTRLLKSTTCDFPQDLQDFDKRLLPQQISNWLVYDHLRREDYQYTLSTFVSESKLSSPENLLTACDVLRLFGLDSNNLVYQRISQIYVSKSEKGVLHSLILAVIKSLLEMQQKGNLKINKLAKEDEMNSTVDEDGKKSELKNAGKSNGQTVNETNFLISENLQEQNSGVFHHNNQSGKMSFQEQLQYVREEKEKEVQRLRQKLMEELDRLHARQMELEREKSDLKRERNSYLNDKDSFQEKKLLLEKELETKYKKQLRELDVEFKSHLQLKGAETDSLQTQIVAKGQRIFELETNIRTYKQRCDALEKDLADQRQMYTVVQEKYAALLEENVNLQKNFESMTDYPIIKDELNRKIKENVDLENKLIEARKAADIEKQKLNEKLQELKQKLITKDPELLQAKRELDIAKEALSREKDVSNKERKKLEQELHNSKEMYKTVIQRIEEQRQDIHDLHNTIHFLHYQISSNIPLSEKKTTATEFSQKGASTRDFRSGFQKGFTQKINQPLRDFSPKYKEHALSFISEAKNRIDRLQKEAEAVQDKYSFIVNDVTKGKSGFMHLDLNSTVPKTYNIYDFPINSVAHYSTSSPLHSSNYFDNLVKNEMSFLNLKSATNIKRIISSSSLSNTLLPDSRQWHSQIGGKKETNVNFYNEIWKDQLREISKETSIPNLPSYNSHIVPKTSTENTVTESVHNIPSNTSSINTIPSNTSGSNIIPSNTSGINTIPSSTSGIDIINDNVFSAPLNLESNDCRMHQTETSNKIETKLPESFILKNQEETNSKIISPLLQDLKSNDNIDNQTIVSDKTQLVLSESSKLSKSIEVDLMSGEKSKINDTNSENLLEVKQNEELKVSKLETTELFKIKEHTMSENALELDDNLQKCEQVLESEKINTSISSKDSPPLDLIIDLDAAWKRRKSSLSDLTLKDAEFLNKTEEPRTNEDHNYMQNNDFQHLESNSKIAEFSIKSSQDKSLLSLPSTSETNQKEQFQTQSEHELEQTSVTEECKNKEMKQNFETLGNENRNDETIKKDSNIKDELFAEQVALLNNNKQNQKNYEVLSAESASELSEIQLSCGSEQEAKDEEDFW